MMAPITRPSGGWIAAISTLLLHAGLAYGLPMPGLFNKYGLAAQQYLEGTLPGERLMDFSPFYFHLSVLAERCSGSPAVLLQVLQIFLASASVGLFYWLMRQRFSVLWASLAAVTLAVDPLLLVYERILEPEAFQLFFLLAFIAVLKAPDSALPSNVAPWLAGLLAALCLATRPTFLPAFLALPLFYRWHLARDDRGTSWRRAGMAALLPVVLVLVLLGWRAHQASGDWRTPTMNPGTVFFEGNNPLSRGTSAIYPPVVLHFIHSSQQEIPDSGHAHYRRVARADTGKPLTPRQVNAYWSQKTWQFIRQEPIAFAQRLLTKLLYAFHNFRWHDVPTAWSYEPSLPLPSIPFALLAALALFGALFEARKWRQSLIFYLLAGIQLGVMLVFYVSARQRLAILPAVIYFAAVAAERFWQQRQGRFVGLAATLLLALALWLPDAAMRDETYRRQSFRAARTVFESTRALALERPAASSQQQVVQGLVLAPWWLDGFYPAYFPRTSGTLETRVLEGLSERQVPSAFDDALRFDIATMALRADPQRLATVLQPLLDQPTAPIYRGGRQSSEPGLLLAQLEASEGRQESAQQLLNEALEGTPGDPFVLAEMVALNGDDAARRTLLDYWSSADARLLIGRAQLRLGKFAAAEETFASLVQDLPEFRDAGVYLAAAMAGSKRYDEGVAQYLRVAAEHPEPILRPDDIIQLFDGWVRQHAEDPQSVFYAAQILHRHGEFDRAYDLLTQNSPPPHVAAIWQQELARIEANRAADREH